MLLMTELPDRLIHLLESCILISKHDPKHLLIIYLWAHFVLTAGGCNNYAGLYLTATTMHPDAVTTSTTKSLNPSRNSVENIPTLTPLHQAVRGGHLSYAESLIRSGADVNQQSATGKTPLHFSVLANDARMTTILLHNGARIDIKDDSGRTPMDYWESDGNLEVLELLQKADVSHRPK